MSAYDDAVAYLDAEVHPRCDYDIYSGMRDIVDAMEGENARLRELVRDMWVNGMCECDECGAFDKGQSHCAECEYHYPDCMRALGIEV